MGRGKLLASPDRAVTRGSSCSHSSTRRAVPIRRSITPDFLICLDDGKRFKSLRRHLTSLGLTPAQYRAKWNLPSDYPMTAPNYAAQRSAIAKTLGLGQLKRKAGARKSNGRSKTAKP